MTKKVSWVLLALSVCCTQLQAANSGSESRFVGCYDVVSIHSNPPDLPTGGIPGSFDLTNRPTIFRDRSFQLTAPTATTAPARLHHLWRPVGSRVTVQFGWGLGGWVGTLKPSGANELGGKLKPFCDGPCGGVKQVVTIRIRRVECPK